MRGSQDVNDWRGVLKVLCSMVISLWSDQLMELAARYISENDVTFARQAKACLTSFRVLYQTLVVLHSPGKNDNCWNI